jgi:cytochrome P450/NADPH-cytochrome P450 reductase
MTDVLARPDAVRIPEPPGKLPLVGHALQIPTGVDGLFWLMARSAELGPLYRLQVFGRTLLLAGGADVVADLSDTTRFRKSVHDDLVEVRGLAGDGLFTAYEDEPNWRKAHDVLMPAFSLAAMRGYHGTMVQVARSLLASWDAAAGARPVDVPGDMTRLTFDTIGLCGFGYDFRSFDSAERHPFVVALARALGHAQQKGETLPGTGPLRFRQNAQFRTDVGRTAAARAARAGRTCWVACSPCPTRSPARCWTTTTSATRPSPS